MEITRVDVEVCRIDKPEKCRIVENVVVDTGATVSALPSQVIKELGIKLPHTRELRLAMGKVVKRRFGTALFRLQGRKASDDVVRLRKGAPLLSVRALEGLGFEVDPKTSRLKKLDAALML